MLIWDSLNILSRHRQVDLKEVGGWKCEGERVICIKLEIIS